MFGPAEPGPVLLAPQLPELPQETAARKTEPSPTALAFMQWLQQGLASRQIKYNEAGAPVHFTSEGMALVSPLIFKLYSSETGPQADADTDGLQVQREVIKTGWHRMTSAQGSGSAADRAARAARQAQFNRHFPGTPIRRTAAR